MLIIFIIAILAYGLLAYFFLPFFWRHYGAQPAMSASPAVTRTKEGIAGDPLNVGLIGDEAELQRAMAEAGWLPADPLRLHSLWDMAKTLALKEPYPQAPVSHLYLFGRKEDLAFEKAAGPTLKQRHHVRFWRADALGIPGRPFWIGAATFDVSLGLSRYTGQILHHIAPDVDAERDRLIADLQAAGRLASLHTVSGIGPTLNGRNGEGDWYYSDGDVAIGVLSPAAEREAAAPSLTPPPPAVAVKNRLWAGLRFLLSKALGRRPGKESHPL